MPARASPASHLAGRASRAWRHLAWQAVAGSGLLAATGLEPERAVAVAAVWLLPVVMGAVWPLLLAFWWHRPILAIFDGMALIGGIATYVVVSTRGRSSRLAFHLWLGVIAVCLAIVAAFTGGLASPKAVWLILVPLTAVLWSDRRAARAWTLATALLFPLLSAAGSRLPPSLWAMPPDFYTFGLWLSLTTQLVFVASLLTSSEDSRARSWRAVLAKQAELADELAARLAAEKDLRVAEDRYRGLVEHIPAVTYVNYFDPSAGHDYVSPQVEALVGYSAAEWLRDRRLWVSRLHPDDRDRVVAGLQHSLSAREPFSAEYRYLHREGRIIWVRDEGVVIRDADGVPLFLQGIVTDIGEHKRLQERLAYGQRMELVGRLAGGVAHDFNNLLTVIVGNAGFALEELSPISQRAVRGDLELVLDAAERAQVLTTQLLNFSRRQIIEPRAVSPDALIGDMGEMLRRLVGPRVRLVVVPSLGLGSVRVDPGQIEQVILNLAVNARDAMPDGGTLTIETGNASLGESEGSPDGGPAPGEYVVITVSDTGCGMTEEVRAHVFEPFFTTKQVGKGTGLGMASAYGIVRQHGGTIEVSSEVAKGTTVRVYLPRVGPSQPAGIPPPTA